MSDLPVYALSVRQPWAWAIIHAGKDIENRSWKHGNPGLKFRGRVAIHAAKGMTRDEYEDGADWIRRCGARCPHAADLWRGGIIGTVEIADVVRSSMSPWFFGPVGLKLRDPLPIDFIPSSGALGFFRWTAGDVSMVPDPARWMLQEGRG